VSDAPADGATPALLVGPLSIDRYIDEGIELPGGGALNMAFHWAEAGVSFRLLSRVGDDRVEVFVSFLQRHGIEALPSLVVPGASASIDIEMRADRQPWMSNFIEGVWSGFEATAGDVDALRASSHVHAVLVDVVAEQIERWGSAGVLDGLDVSGDFLSFRHYSVDRFEATMRWLSLGFVGWPGDRDDPTVRDVAEVAARLGKLVVVTLGAQGVLLLDGRSGSLVERFVPVQAVAVAGTTVGCGDAFIAAFLARWWQGSEVDDAVAAGKAAGAAATAWIRPLPDRAFATGGSSVPAQP
jgi:sugar/nucleoside kinase (ribokinase family)